MGAFGRRLVQMELRLTATCHTTHHAPCSAQRICDLPRTTRNVQHAPCSMQQTTWGTQQPTCNMQYRNMPRTGTTAARRLSRTDSTASRTIGSALSTTPPTRMRSSDETKLSRLSSSALFHYGPVPWQHRRLPARRGLICAFQCVCAFRVDVPFARGGLRQYAEAACCRRLLTQ